MICLLRTRFWVRSFCSYKYSTSTAEARLIARVHYTQTSEERRNNITPTPSEFYVPVFRENGGAASLNMSRRTEHLGR